MNPEGEAVSFPGWKDALLREALAPATRGSCRREIVSFLHHCKLKRSPATVMLAKQYPAERERQGSGDGRDVLRS